MTGPAEKTSLPDLGTRLALFYVFIEYARPQYYVPLLNYARLGMIATGLGGLYLVFAKRNPIPRVGWAMLVFLAVMAKTIPFAPNEKLAYFSTQALFFTMLAGPLVIMTALNTTERLGRVTRLYVLLGAVMAVQALLHGGRGVGGFFTDENDVAMLLVTVMPLAFFYGVNAPTLTRRLAGFAVFALSVVGVTASFSRGGFLAMAAVTVYIVFRSRHKLAAIAAITLALLVVVPFVPEGYYKEMNTIETANQKGDTGEQRLYMWGVAWKVFLHHPIMGVGIENYPRVAQEFEDPTRGRHLWGFACHSTYFTLFAEGGVPGTIAWGAMVVLAFAATHRAGRLAQQQLARAGLQRSEVDRARALFAVSRGVEGAIIGFLVAGVFLTVIYYPVLWTLVALAAACSITADRECPLPAGAAAAKA